MTKDELHVNLECINETFSISLKARELRDHGLLDQGDDIIHQSANLGELMWVHVWSQLDQGFRPKNALDRGEQVVVKSRHDQL